MAAHRFHPTLLREYDIRGTVGQTLEVADARAIGLAFGTVVRRAGGRCVAVAYDGRFSSPDLAQALAEGLRDCGLRVRACGQGPTPMLYFAAQDPEVQAGVMVTGSHNPPDFNGFKFIYWGRPFFGESIQDLGRLAAAGDFETGDGRIETLDLMDAFIARLLEGFEGRPDLKVAWDAGNGAAGEAMVRLTRGLPGTHHLLFEDIDGAFPNHHPDPVKAENLQDLIACVRDRGCDLGIAFDGDGDRLGVVDNEGEILWGDQVMILFAREVLESHPGAPVVADVKSSQVLFDEIARAGGQPVMHRTGHAPIKARMAELKAPLGGELSAHIFFADRYYGYDDALYAAVRLLAIVSRMEGSLADFRRSLPPLVNTPEIRVACAEERKFAVVEEIKSRLTAAGAALNDIDGVRVQEPGGWWLLRASNTEPSLVVRCEASNEEALAEMKARVAAELQASGLESPAVEI